MLMLVAETVD
jgi:hypothetical protein